LKVKDFMITNVVKVQPDTSLKDLLTKLVERKIGGVPVVNERDQLVGMISDGDVLRFIKPIAAKHVNLLLYCVELDKVLSEDIIPTQLERPVKDCMRKTNLITLSENDGLEEIVSVLSQHHFKKVPVLDAERRVVGVISRGDIIRYIVSNWIK
jgi:CBS domain-containing protein